MFQFLSSLFGKKEQPFDAHPLIAEDDPVIATNRSQVLDIRGMLSQATTRVPLGRLGRWGRKAVNLLSRDKINELINRAVRTIVDKYRVVDFSTGTVPQTRIAAEAHKEFDSLLAQYLRSAQDGEDSKQPFEIVSGNPRPELSFDNMQLEYGRGLHVGTVNMVAAAKTQGMGDFVFVSERNAFLDVLADEATRKLMRQLNIGYISQGENGYIVGDAALGLGRIFGKP